MCHTVLQTLVGNLEKHLENIQLGKLKCWKKTLERWLWSIFAIEKFKLKASSPSRLLAFGNRGKYFEKENNDRKLKRIDCNWRHQFVCLNKVECCCDWYCFCTGSSWLSIGVSIWKYSNWSQLKSSPEPVQSCASVTAIECEGAKGRIGRKEKGRREGKKICADGKVKAGKDKGCIEAIKVRAKVWQVESGEVNLQ